MLLRTHDTIVAIASAPGGALRGIVRVSGHAAIENAAHWFRAAGSESLTELQRATAIAGSAILNDQGNVLPGHLYVWPGERSYTRQPTLEFHTLGSPPLLARLVQNICMHGARAAEPGEFTLRAFLAGRLDLTQAEAVLGVIDADSQRELQVALEQLGGGLAGPLNRLRNQLLDTLAHLEAGLDFVEEDIEFIATDILRQQLVDARDAIAALVVRMSARSGGESNYRVVLYGKPNVGKSSLLNALAEAEHAIVSEVAGTTRDYVTVNIECGGLRCQLVDTAGLCESEGETIESAAQVSSRQQSEAAHLRLLCLDSTRTLEAWEQDEMRRSDPQRLIVLTKCDAAQTSLAIGLTTSSRHGTGLVELKQAISERLSRHGTQGDVVAGTAARCRDSLARALGGLEAAIEAVDTDIGQEFVAGDLRIALEELGRVAGAIYTDDILDRIFSRFCIGK